MTKIKALMIITCCMVMILPCTIYSQNTEVNEANKEQLMIAAREIMDASGTCALITLDEASIPMVRIMDPFPPESDFTVWFGTNRASRKVNQIKGNPNVTLYYQDEDASGYVVLHGQAQIVDDEEEKQARWKEEWEVFYPNDREGYLLIRVDPEWMEILSYTRGIVGDPKTWETPVVNFD